MDQTSYAVANIDSCDGNPCVRMSDLWSIAEHVKKVFMILTTLFFSPETQRQHREPPGNTATRVRPPEELDLREIQATPGSRDKRDLDLRLNQAERELRLGSRQLPLKPARLPRINQDLVRSHPLRVRLPSRTGVQRGRLQTVPAE